MQHMLWLFQDFMKEPLCRLSTRMCCLTITLFELVDALAASASQAVRDDWYFQMYYDDLPVWGFIGKVGKQLAQQAQDMRVAFAAHSL